MHLVSEEEMKHLQAHAEMEKAFKQNEQVAALMEYKLRKEQIEDISESDTIENEDAFRLMRVVIGGYVDDEFTTYLSYKDFQ